MKDIVMWEGTDALGIKATCLYQPEKMQFKVEVKFKDKTKTETFGQSFTPTFGMDVIDLSRSQEIAEKLAVEMENETAN